MTNGDSKHALGINAFRLGHLMKFRKEFIVGKKHLQFISIPH